MSIIVAVYLLLRHDDIETTSGADTIKIVDAPTSTGQTLEPAISPVISPMTPATLTKTDVEKRIVAAGALGEVQATCNGATCTVTAMPPVNPAGFDQRSFERLVNHDLATAITVSGYDLAEPIQIEEVGADRYRLRFTLRLGQP